MKKSLILALGFFVLSTGLLLANIAKAKPAAFTLANPSGGAARSNTPGMSFWLAGALAEPSPGAGSGYGIIETEYPLCLTAIGWQALFSNTTGGHNTASGARALFYNTSGFENTASGSQALFNNTTGSRNTAVGYNALYYNTGGDLDAFQSSSNTAIGAFTLYYNTTGNFNTAIGAGAIEHNTTGWQNTAIGSYALSNNPTGDFNTAIGSMAMHFFTEGDHNIAIGQDAGSNAKTGWWNIWVGNEGTETDGGVIRIGRAGTQTGTWIAGIIESPPFIAGQNPAVVGITSDGRLGTIPPELLPTAGPTGPQGPPGAAGTGLMSGSLLLLPSTIASPAGYNLIGSTELKVDTPDKKSVKIIINVYQKL